MFHYYKIILCDVILDYVTSYTVRLEGWMHPEVVKIIDAVWRIQGRGMMIEKKRKEKKG